MKKDKNTVITCYYRVSTKAESQKTSFEAQPQIVKTMLAMPKYKHYKPAKRFYFDYGTSGTKLNRPGFKAMLEDAGLDVETIRKEKIPHPDFPDQFIDQNKYVVTVNPKKKPLFEEIWIKNTSRFARNINGYDIIQTLRLAGVYVYFIDLALTSRNSKDMPAIRKRLDEDMAYSEQLSRNREIVQAQYEQENRLSGCPYGYIRHNKTQTSLPYYTIHPEEGEAVRRIFQYCIEGMGAVAIGKRLAEEGFYTRKGKVLRESTIKKILENEKYKGLNTCGKYTTGTVFEKLNSAKVQDDYQERLQENEGLPAIVTPEIWEKAHRAFKSRKTRPDAPNGKRPMKNPMNEKLKCRYCGSHFVYDNNGGRGFYKCATKANKGVAACNCNNLYADKLEMVIKRCQEGGLYETIKVNYEWVIISLITLISGYLEKYNHYQDFAEESSEYKEMTAQITELQEKRDTLMELYLGSKTSASGKEKFKQDMEEIEEQIAEIEEKQADLLTSKESILDMINQLFESAFEQFKEFEGLKKTYTREEVFEKVDHFVVAGETKFNTGGRPPVTICFPSLKAAQRAELLINKGRKEFNYKIRISDPFYELPGEYKENEKHLHPWDDDSLTVEERKALLPKITKKSWPRFTSSVLLFNNVYVALKNNAFGGCYTLDLDLGVVENPVIKQLKEHLEKLYQEYLAIA